MCAREVMHTCEKFSHFFHYVPLGVPYRAFYLANINIGPFPGYLILNAGSCNSILYLVTCTCIIAANVTCTCRIAANVACTCTITANAICICPIAANVTCICRIDANVCAAVIDSCDVISTFRRLLNADVIVICV